jgi:hypothetical protein
MDREAPNDYPLGLYDITVEIVTFVPDQETGSTSMASWTSPRVWLPAGALDEGALVTSYLRLVVGGRAGLEERRHLPGDHRARVATPGILARTFAPGKPRPAPSSR